MKKIFLLFIILISTAYGEDISLNSTYGSNTPMEIPCYIADAHPTSLETLDLGILDSCGTFRVEEDEVDIADYYGENTDTIENYEIFNEDMYVIFPADMEHSGCTHTDNLLRGVINFNWF